MRGAHTCMTANRNLNRYQNWGHWHEKRSPVAVHYRLAIGPENCGGCTMKHGPNCDILTINVDDRHVCDEYDPK